MSDDYIPEDILDSIREQALEDGSIEIRGAGGSVHVVLNDQEAAWINFTYERYVDQYKMDNITDLQDLDRLVGLELLSTRYQNWLGRESDYDGNPFSEKDVRDHKEKIDKEIRLLKKSMGIDRVGRTTSETQNVSDYLSSLLQRAEEFGVHRDHQIAKSIDLWKELQSKIGMYDRCDEEERIHERVTLEDIYSWLKTEAFPEFDKIDDAFRKNQKLWIKAI